MSDIIDFNDAEGQVDMSALIPAGTMARVSMGIRSNNPDGLVNAKTSDSKMLDCEFTVIGGAYNGKKFWQYMVVSGSTGRKDSSGKIIAHNISRSTLRAIIESARDISPTDITPKAVAARQIAGYGSFSGMEFATKIAIQKSEDKNKLGAIMTPDKKEYVDIMAGKAVQIVKPKPKTAQKAQTIDKWMPSPEDAPPIIEDDMPDPQHNVDDVPEWAK